MTTTSEPDWYVEIRQHLSAHENVDCVVVLAHADGSLWDTLMWSLGWRKVETVSMSSNKYSARYRCDEVAH